MDDRRYELGNENIGRLLLRYALPASVGMFVNSLNGIIDTIFIGNTEHGTLALAVHLLVLEYDEGTTLTSCEGLSPNAVTKALPLARILAKW